MVIFDAQSTNRVSYLYGILDEMIHLMNEPPAENATVQEEFTQNGDQKLKLGFKNGSQ
jgi:hypothetical protein